MTREEVAKAFSEKANLFEVPSIGVIEKLHTIELDKAFRNNSWLVSTGFPRNVLVKIFTKWEHNVWTIGRGGCPEHSVHGRDLRVATAKDLLKLGD